MKAWYFSMSVCLAFNVLSFSMAPPANGAIDESSIVAIWLFDEGDGEVANDSSENGNDAEFQGAVKLCVSMAARTM